jgi:hypothetical protein
MPLVLRDRVKETSTTTGTGTLTLGGAASGFQSFSVIGNGNSTYYAIFDRTSQAWEVGVGTYTSSGTTLTRDTVLESSNSGNKVDFGAGSKDVFCTYPAEKAVTLDDVQTLTNKTINLTSNTLVATSAQIAAAVTDETGTGALVFANSPTLVTPALGTPASGVVTNLTGTASININGTVGATTASTGAFTTLSATGVTTVQAGTVSAPAITTSGDTNTGIFFPAADTIAFAEGGAEAMRINSSGQVKINTTATVSTASNEVLAVDAGTSGGYGGVFATNTTGGFSCIYLKTGSNVGNLALFYRDTTIVGSITTNGTTTAFNASSDYRLKHDIQPMTGALAKVQQLKPVTYKWNTDNSESQGFIAHELQEIVPECVTGEKDAVDAEGKPVYQGIDTSFLVATLTAAIQEQQVIINDIKAELDTVKAELATLKRVQV